MPYKTYQQLGPREEVYYLEKCVQIIEEKLSWGETRERLPDIFFLKAKIALAQNLSGKGKFLLTSEALWCATGTEPHPILKRHLRKEK